MKANIYKVKDQVEWFGIINKKIGDFKRLDWTDQKIYAQKGQE